MSYWSVVQCESRMLIHNSERNNTLAEYMLERNGFETYLPKTKAKVHGRNRIAPLFPGYILVRVVAQWYPVRWTIGVIRVLMSGEEPAHLSDHVVEAIRRREIKGYVKLPPPPPKNAAIRIGQSVKILTGSFTGHFGLYEGQTDKERERVLLDLLGRQVPVTLAEGDKLVAISYEINA